MNQYIIMHGIYIHIPYCRQACSYCNFHFSVSWRNRQDYIKAVLREIFIQRHFFDDCLPSGKPTGIDTVYFGGGTPSTLTVNDIRIIINKLNNCFDLSNVVEFTLEANPDDLTAEYLAELIQTPVNRLSIGIQSFHKADLLYMNRVHTPEQAIDSLRNAQKIGFEKLSIDLIYGTPTMTDSMLRENLEIISDGQVPHISAYALTVEPKTPLDYYIRRGRAEAMHDEKTARQFEIIAGFFRERGYLHYEISNFAAPGHVSKHNVSYWQGKPYLGIGPSAHSFRQNKRFWNVSNTSEYIASINKNKLPQNGEVLSDSQAFNEYIMTSLRTVWGCDLNFAALKWGTVPTGKLEHEAMKYIDRGMMMRNDGKLVLTDKGKLFADGIAADLFIKKKCF